MCRVIRSFTGTWPVEMYWSARLLCSGRSRYAVDAQLPVVHDVGVAGDGRSVLGRPPKNEIRPLRAAIAMACSWVTLAAVAVMITSRLACGQFHHASPRRPGGVDRFVGATASADIFAVGPVDVHSGRSARPL